MKPEMRVTNATVVDNSTGFILDASSPTASIHDLAINGLTTMDAFLLQTKVRLATMLLAPLIVLGYLLSWLMYLLVRSVVAPIGWQGNYQDSMYGAYVFTSDWMSPASTTTQPDDVLTFTVLQNSTSLHASPIFLNVRSCCACLLRYQHTTSSMRASICVSS